MEIDIFDIIDYKLAEIMTTIEKQLPLLIKEIPDFVAESEENAKLYDTYIEISNLRNL